MEKINLNQNIEIEEKLRRFHNTTSTNISSQNPIESTIPSSDSDSTFELITITNKHPKDQTPILSSKLIDTSYFPKRHTLPAPYKKTTISIFTLIKNALGKDLSKYSVPVYFNEPLSMLQRLCENFQYGDLLNKAAIEPNSNRRLALTAAFCISSFSLDPNRTLKFFNPLLGETYEFVDNNLSIRYFAEQVSHHPAISACFAEGEHFTYTSNTDVKTNIKFFKATLEFFFKSKVYVEYKKFKETITFTRPIAAARNLLGNIYVDCYGRFELFNHKTGDYGEIEITEADKNKQGELYGIIRNKDGIPKIIIEGNWLSHIEMFDLEENKRSVIWRRIIIDGNAQDKYYFTDFAINLNNINTELKKVLPRTDSRFRPDQRALEFRDVNSAVKEKDRLEEKQRKKRREMEELGIEYKPVYFNREVDVESGEVRWVFNGKYWVDRERQEKGGFKDLPDIF